MSRRPILNRPADPCDLPSPSRRHIPLSDNTQLVSLTLIIHVTLITPGRHLVHLLFLRTFRVLTDSLPIPYHLMSIPDYAALLCRIPNETARHPPPSRTFPAITKPLASRMNGRPGARPGPQRTRSLPAPTVTSPPLAFTLIVSGTSWSSASHRRRILSSTSQPSSLPVNRLPFPSRSFSSFSSCAPGQSNKHPGSSDTTDQASGSSVNNDISYVSQLSYMSYMSYFSDVYVASPLSYSSVVRCASMDMSHSSEANEAPANWSLTVYVHSCRICERCMTPAHRMTSPL